MNAWLEVLGAARCPPFQRDRGFLAAVAAGALFWLALAVVQPPPLPRPQPLALASAALWQPLVEELLFRGAVQGELLRHPWGRRAAASISMANLATSAAFAAAHLASHPPLWAAAVVVPSLVFGWLRERLGSVWPAVALHILYNLGYFLLYGTPS